MFFNIAGISGFLLGVKLCDVIFFRPEKYELLRESMEDEYWRINGEPTEIEPELVACIANPLKLRKSWIQIRFGKDNYIRKPE